MGLSAGIPIANKYTKKWFYSKSPAVRLIPYSRYAFNLLLKERMQGNARLPVGRDFTGRPMRGFVFINADGVKTKSI